MTNRDAGHFACLMMALGEAFSQEASAQKVEIYFRALQDIDIKAVERAVWQIIKTRGTATFPKVAEIREAAHGNLDDVALLALLRTEKAMRDIGAYTTVVFDDPVIHMVISAFDGGWRAIGHIPDSEWKFKRQEFVRLYKAFARNPVQYPATLTGIHEQQNTLNGFSEHINPPVFIGDEQKAKALLEGAEGLTKTRGAV